MLTLVQPNSKDDYAITSATMSNEFSLSENTHEVSDGDGEEEHDLLVNLQKLLILLNLYNILSLIKHGVDYLKHINVQIPEELHRKLKQIAAKDGKNLKDVVTEAFDEYVENRGGL